MRPVNVFILAAGLGERLRPITDHTPKPLLPVLGEPVIGSVIDRLRPLKPAKIGINMHYKADMIRQWASAAPLSDRITLFMEDSILGTGGALKNAASMLSESTFLVHNADIISDIDLSRLLELHEDSGNLATLAVHDFPAFNNVWIGADNRLKTVCRQAPPNAESLRPLAFTGIAVYSPDFLELLPEGVSSVLDAWVKAVSLGRSIGAVDFTGCRWTDIGSPSSYAQAVRDALERSGEQFYISDSLDCPGLGLEGWAVLEDGAIIRGGATLRRAIVLPGAEPAPGSDLQDVIAGPGYTVRISLGKQGPEIGSGATNSLVLKDFSGYRREIYPVGLGGSDRRYYRMRNASNMSVILLESPVDDPDYIRQITFTGFFRAHGFPVPDLLASCPEEGLALFEDLGDVSLYIWLKCRRTPKEVERLYKKVLDLLVVLHTRASEKIDECKLLTTRCFDHGHLRWETDYFLERFVRGVRHMQEDGPDALMTEFDDLAKEVGSFKKTILHRDFQSQNIIITSGDTPRIIDYQGARLGPPAYDLVSLLWDPYHRLEGALRDRLVEHYLRGMEEYRDGDWSREELGRTILACRLQRHMQALGAYGFLSKVKGKPYFLRHVPLALEYLTEETEMARAAYPCLFRLVRRMNETA